VVELVKPAPTDIVKVLGYLRITIPEPPVPPLFGAAPPPAPPPPPVLTVAFPATEGIPCVAPNPPPPSPPGLTVESFLEPPPPPDIIYS